MSATNCRAKLKAQEALMKLFEPEIPAPTWEEFRALEKKVEDSHNRITFHSIVFALLFTMLFVAKACTP